MRLEQNEFLLSPLGVLVLDSAASTEKVVVPMPCRLIGIVAHTPGSAIDTEIGLEVEVNGAVVPNVRVDTYFTTAELAGDVGAVFDMKKAEDETGAINEYKDMVNLQTGDAVQVTSNNAVTATGADTKFSFLFRQTSL